MFENKFWHFLVMLHNFTQRVVCFFSFLATEPPWLVGLSRGEKIRAVEEKKIRIFFLTKICDFFVDQVINCSTWWLSYSNQHRCWSLSIKARQQAKLFVHRNQNKFIMRYHFIKTTKIRKSVKKRETLSLSNMYIIVN